MQTIRSLQRRQDGIELWTVIPSQAETERSFLVRGPDVRNGEAMFDDVRSARAEFNRRVSAYGNRHEHWYCQGYRQAG